MKIKGGERSIRQAVYDIVGDTGLEFQVIGTHTVSYTHLDVYKRQLHIRTDYSQFILRINRFRTFRNVYIQITTRDSVSYTHLDVYKRQSYTMNRSS